MSRKKRHRQQSTARRTGPSAIASALAWIRRHFRRGATIGGGLTMLALAVFGIARLDAHVQKDLLIRMPRASVEFVDLPADWSEAIRAELTGRIADLSDRAWTDENLCAESGTRIQGSGWIAKLGFVRRTGDGRIEVRARYREPEALVWHAGEFFLVDADSVRLPGMYPDDPRYPLIQGAESPPPSPGVRWEGDDLKAGLALLKAVETEPFRHQIIGVLVDNFAGRRNPRATHIELVTDRPSGRIRWGSAPGFELEENLLPQKLALLRQNYAKTGRVDARNPVIDVSTFPDRFTIPG